MTEAVSDKKPNDGTNVILCGSKARNRADHAVQRMAHNERDWFGPHVVAVNGKSSDPEFPNPFDK